MKEHHASGAVDRAALMAEIHQRVAAKKEKGAYLLDALASPAALPDEPFDPDTVAELGRIAEIYPNMALARSDRRGLGNIVSRVKTGLTRATSQPLLDTANQASAFNALLLAYVIELGAEVERLKGILNAHGIATQREEN